MFLSYKKVLPIVLAFNIGLTATLPSLAMTESSQKIFNEAELQKNTEALRKELFLKHGKKIKAQIDLVRIKIDKAVDSIVAEIEADESNQKAKGETVRFNNQLAADYFTRHRSDFKQTELGVIIYQFVPTVLNKLSPEEQFVFKSLLADMFETQNYAKQYDRYETAIGGGVGVAIAFIIYATKIYSGKMAAGIAEDFVPGFFLLVTLSMTGMFIGDSFTLGVDAQQKTQNVQRELKLELSNLRSEAESALEELVRAKFYPETLK